MARAMALFSLCPPSLSPFLSSIPSLWRNGGKERGKGRRTPGKERTLSLYPLLLPSRLISLSLSSLTWVTSHIPSLKSGKELRSELQQRVRTARPLNPLHVYTTVHACLSRARYSSRVQLTKLVKCWANELLNLVGCYLSLLVDCWRRLVRDIMRRRSRRGRTDGAVAYPGFLKGKARCREAWVALVCGSYFP